MTTTSREALIDLLPLSRVRRAGTDLRLRPTTAEEIQSILRAAGESGTALVPVSSGPPHTQTSDPDLDAVTVDLSEMKRVLRVDRRNRVAMLEPGVTFGELAEALRSHGLRALTPLRPRTNKSVVAAYLEREPVTIPRYHWDMQDPLACVEVVFGTGDLFRTGSAAGPGSLEEQWRSKQAQKNPMGPGQSDTLRLIQGSQGSLGIVTWATIRVELDPQRRNLALVAAEDFGCLVDAVYELMWRRLGDECFICNAEGLSALTGTGSEGLPPWTLVLGTSGLDILPEVRLVQQDADSAEVLRCHGLEPAATLGHVTADELKAALATTADPPWRGAAGDLFFQTTLDQVQGFVDRVEDLTGRGLGVYVQPQLQGRCVHLEFLFPPEFSDDLAAAARLVDAGGAFFSRPNGPWRDLAIDAGAEELLRKVKSIFDPHDVMNPGRLYPLIESAGAST